MQAILAVGLQEQTLSRLRADLNVGLLWKVAKDREQTLARLGADATVDLLVLGPGLADPVGLAQDAHAVDRNLPVFILAPPEACAQMRQQVLFAPFLGSDISCWSTEAHQELVAALGRTLERNQQRRHYQAAVRPHLDRDLVWDPVRPESARFLLHQLLEHAPIGVVLLDADLRITSLNQRARTLLAMDADHRAPDASLHTFFPAAQRQALSAFVAECTSAQMPPPRIFTRPLPNPGGLLQVEITLAKITSPDESFSLMAILQDVTERERAVEEGRRREKLEGVLEMAGAICHELGQPLQVIWGTLDLFELRMAQKQVEIEEFSLLRVSAERMGQSIRKIQRITRYESLEYPGSQRHIVDIDRASGSGE